MNRSTFSRRRVNAKRNNYSKQKGTIENLLRFTPIAYTLLVIYSFVGQNAYYSEFGISILGHTTFQEILISPLKAFTKSITLLFTIFFGLVYVFLILNVIDHKRNKDKETKKTLLKTSLRLLDEIFWAILISLRFVKKGKGATRFNRPNMSLVLLLMIILISCIYFFIKFVFFYPVFYNSSNYSLLTYNISFIWLFTFYFVLILPVKNEKKEDGRSKEDHLLDKVVFSRVASLVCLLVLLFAFNVLTMKEEVLQTLNKAKMAPEFSGLPSPYEHVKGTVVGETSSTLFLIDSSLVNTVAYQKKENRIINYPLDLKFGVLIKPEASKHYDLFQKLLKSLSSKDINESDTLVIE